MPEINLSKVFPVCRYIAYPYAYLCIVIAKAICSLTVWPYRG